MSRLSPAHLRMAGLGTAVAIAVLVPLAAKADRPDGAPPSTAHAPALPPSGSSRSPAGDADSGDVEPGAEPGDAKAGDAQSDGAQSDDAPVGDAQFGGVAGGVLGELGLGGEEGEGRTGGSARPAVPKEVPPSVSVAAEAAGVPERVSRCGPEVASPEGVEAQTCVLSEGPDVWGRTYYRNATGREIDAIVTLMAPGGRTVQVRCAVPARDEPGTCETPREPGTGAARAHTAVAEFAAREEGGEAPLLVRSGSNTADDQAS
ncbi:hypothetical protein ACF1E9_09475 [Streptomyces roseolus]|uniref:hypothetical protein n=1 Tax=Streptomyces roseolus TaxID=67358 RepID=UPI0036F84595